MTTKRKPRAEQALKCIARLNSKRVPWSNADLAREMGASRATTAGVVGALLRDGLVVMKRMTVTVELPCVVEVR